MRAVAHRTLHKKDNFAKLHEDPEAGMTKIEQYPSDEFLENTEPWMLARYCNFLLQSAMILTRVFQVPKKSLSYVAWDVIHQRDLPS